MDLAFRTECLSLPGYTEVHRGLSLASGNTRALWQRLGIFTVQEAEDFLRAPMKAIAAKARRGEMKDEEFLEIVLLFAAMSVYAERDRAREEPQCS